MIRFLLLALLLAVFVSTAIAKSRRAPDRSQTQDTNQPTASDQRGTENSPAVIKILPPDDAKAKAQQEADDRAAKEELDRNTIKLGIAGILMAFLQFVAIGIQALFLWLAFRESRQASTLGKQALVANRRAFVYAKGFNPYYEFNAATQTYSWRFRPIWANTGDTPTRGMRICTACDLLAAQMPATFNFNAPHLTGTGLIGPKAENFGGIAPLNPDPAITAQDLVDVQNGTKFLYLWGWVKYFDVFDKTPEHITRFCWAIVPEGTPLAFNPFANPPPQAPVLSFSYVMQPHGNCADEECTP